MGLYTVYSLLLTVAYCDKSSEKPRGYTVII